MTDFFKRFSCHIAFTLIATLGWQQLLVAQTTSRVPGFTILTTSNPGFTASKNTKFSWLLEDIEISKDAPVSAQRAHEMISDAIAEELNSKGLPVAPVGSPSDYYVAYTLATQSTVDDDTLMKRYNISPGFNAPVTGANIYEKGTLLIHVINAKTRQTVWQSAVQAGIQYDISEEQRRENIRAVVRTMLRNFPVSS